MKQENITKEQAEWILQNAAPTPFDWCYVHIMKTNTIVNILMRYASLIFVTDNGMVFKASREFLATLYALSNPKKEVHVHIIKICLN